jgi:hypothetical protein
VADEATTDSGASDDAGPASAATQDQDASADTAHNLAPHSGSSGPVQLIAPSGRTVTVPAVLADRFRANDYRDA